MSSLVAVGRTVKTVYVGARFEPELVQWLDERAQEGERSRSAELRRLVRRERSLAAGAGRPEAA